MRGPAADFDDLLADHEALLVALATARQQLAAPLLVPVPQASHSEADQVILAAAAGGDGLYFAGVHGCKDSQSQSKDQRGFPKVSFWSPLSSALSHAACQPARLMIGTHFLNDVRPPSTPSSIPPGLQLPPDACDILLSLVPEADRAAYLVLTPHRRLLALLQDGVAGRAGPLAIRVTPLELRGLSTESPYVVARLGNAVQQTPAAGPTGRWNSPPTALLSKGGTLG